MRTEGDHIICGSNTAVDLGQSILADSGMAASLAPVFTFEPKTTIDLSLNECALEPAMLAFWETVRYLPINRYPSMDAITLREAAAEHYGCATHQIVVGNGSSDIIDAVVSFFCGPDRVLLTTRPCFSMYPVYARAHRIRFVDVPCMPDLGIDEDAFIEAACELKPDLILLTTPNNPTGTTISKRFVRELRAACETATIVIDEAYVEYANAKDTFIPMALMDDHIAVTRTLSKIGYAGLRIGFLVASAEFIKRLHGAARPFRVSGFNTLAGTYALQDREGNQRRIEAVKRERARIYARLLQSVPDVFLSFGNFNVIKVKSGDFDPLIHFGDLAIKLGLFSFDHGTFMRVSVGHPKANDLFLQWIESHGRVLC